MKALLETNSDVAAWLESHCPTFRNPIRAKGSFKNYSTSRTSDCWGQPQGGMKIEGTDILIAVCQPSFNGDIGAYFYDYILTK